MTGDQIRDKRGQEEAQKGSSKGQSGTPEVLHLSEDCMGRSQGLVLGRAVRVVEGAWALKCVATHGLRE